MKSDIRQILRQDLWVIARERQLRFDDHIALSQGDSLGRALQWYQESWVREQYIQGNWIDMRKSRWIDVMLDKDDKRNVRDLADNTDGVMDLLVEAVTRGFRISLSYSGNDRCFIAVASPLENAENKGLITAGRSKDAGKALASVLYKIGVVRAWGAWEAEGDDGDDFLS